MGYIPVIGLGAVCAAGYGVDKGFERIASGSDGLAPLSVLDSELKQTPLCGEVSERPRERLGIDVPDPTAGFALWAAREALDGIENPGRYRLGLVMATTVAGMTRSEAFYKALRSDDDYVRHAAVELAGHEPTATSGFVAQHVNAAGFHTISTACSTGLHAVGIAKRLIEDGRFDLCLAVGTDALSLLTIRGFASLMLIDFDGCKPFDARRVGISLGEGAGALLLASEHIAAQLDRTPAAFVAGWGASADCHHMTAPHPEGKGAQHAVGRALQEAHISPEDISLIATHGTATPDNDVSEVQAMRSVFGSLPPFCSMKRSLGHTLAASGVLEAVFAIVAMNRGVIPATAGFEHADPAIGTTPAPRSAADMRFVLKNSFGFGGNNAAVVLARDAQQAEN